MAFLLQEVHISDFKVFILCYRTMKLFILFVFGLQGQSASGCAPSCAFANKDELQTTLISWWTGDASAKAGIEANYGPIRTWDVTQVTNMGSLFDQPELRDFDANIGGWDVSFVTSMFSMFIQASSFNQPLDSWDVSSVANMRFMFYQASSFNQPLDSWDVSSVTRMDYMFQQASSFNQPLDSWDVSSVTNMDSMFYQASAFSQCLASWELGFPPSNEEMFFETQCAADAGAETLPNGLLDCGCGASGPWCEELDALDYGLLKKKGRQAAKNCWKKSLVKSLIEDNGLEPKLHWERGSGVAGKLLLVGLVIGVLMTMVVSAAVVYRRRRTVLSYEELWEAPWGTALGARNAFAGCIFIVYLSVVCAQDTLQIPACKREIFCDPFHLSFGRRCCIFEKRIIHDCIFVSECSYTKQFGELEIRHDLKETPLHIYDWSRAY